MIDSRAAALRAGDETAFRELVADHSSTLLRLAPPTELRRHCT
jgi:hypothetical protein